MYRGQVFSKPSKPLADILVEIAKETGCEYKKPLGSTQDHWFSVAAPIFTFVQNFKNRYREVRLGDDKITVTKKAEEQTYINSSDYGVNAAQQVLLEGCSSTSYKV